MERLSTEDTADFSELTNDSHDIRCLKATIYKSPSGKRIAVGPRAKVIKINRPIRPTVPNGITNPLDLWDQTEPLVTGLNGAFGPDGPIGSNLLITRSSTDKFIVQNGARLSNVNDPDFLRHCFLTKQFYFDIKNYPKGFIMNCYQRLYQPFFLPKSQLL